MSKIKVKTANASAESEQTPKIDKALADAHAEIQSNHEKGHVAYLLSEIRKLQKKGNK